VLLRSLRVIACCAGGLRAAWGALARRTGAQYTICAGDDDA